MTGVQTCALPIWAEAKKLGVPLLAELPLSIDVRVAGDSGTPIAVAGNGATAKVYAELARELIDRGFA